jgi:hypothetical protein
MVLHVANTAFELELAEESLDLNGLLQSHPVFLQLQFLPKVYAAAQDGMAVTHTPYPAFEKPRYHLLEATDFPYDEIESWGASRAVQAWALSKGLSYKMPPWDVVKQVNSKAFSFASVPPLPGAKLLHCLEETEEWICTTTGPRVLKNCYGVAGKGHLFLPADARLVKQFTTKEFVQGRPIIAEPWVERKLDFSTQWVIHSDQSIEEVGATLLISNDRGQYSANHVGNFYIPHLEEHKLCALPILQQMALLGYFGNVGIDAMVWGNDTLHPIVEINARKTMGWVALQILKHHFPKQTIAVRYVAKSPEGQLLPSHIVQKNGALLALPKQLVVSVLA